MLRAALNPQQPHTRDEITLLPPGVANTFAGTSHGVQRNRLLFAAAGVEHRFETLLTTWSFGSSFTVRSGAAAENHGGECLAKQRGQARLLPDPEMTNIES